VRHKVTRKETIFVLIIGIVIGFLCGAVLMGALSARAYDKGAKDARKEDSA